MRLPVTARNHQLAHNIPPHLMGSHLAGSFGDQVGPLEPRPIRNFVPSLLLKWRLRLFGELRHLDDSAICCRFQVSASHLPEINSFHHLPEKNVFSICLKNQFSASASKNMLSISPQKKKRKKKQQAKHMFSICLKTPFSASAKKTRFQHLPPKKTFSASHPTEAQ